MNLRWVVWKSHCESFWEVFEKASTNIYNFIDSLLVQDVHSYFVNQKGGKTNRTMIHVLGMLACEMVIIQIGTTDPMEYR